MISRAATHLGARSTGQTKVQKAITLILGQPPRGSHIELSTGTALGVSRGHDADLGLHLAAPHGSGKVSVERRCHTVAGGLPRHSVRPEVCANGSGILDGCPNRLRHQQTRRLNGGSNRHLQLRPHLLRRCAEFSLTGSLLKLWRVETRRVALSKPGGLDAEAARSLSLAARW